MKKPQISQILDGMIDSHFHGAHIQDKGIEIAALLDKLTEKGFAGALDIGVNPDDFPQRYRLLENNAGVFFSSGCYPASAADKQIMTDLEGTMQSLKEQFKNPRLRAVGEIGLDYYRMYASKEEQQQLFIRQIELSRELRLPCIIHNREADNDMLDILKQHDNCGGVMHCFGSDLDFAKRVIDLGFFVSFAGNVTYPKAGRILEAAVKIPLGSLLLETDAPYLSPQTVRGHRNHPGFIGYTYEFLADARNISMERLISSVKKNFFSLISLAGE